MLQLNEEQEGRRRKDIKERNGSKGSKMVAASRWMSAGSIPKPRHKPCRV
jgi:hypothetical protein